MKGRVLLLEPPYRECVPLDGRVPALGSVVVAELIGGVVSVVEAAARLGDWPWCPLALVGQAPDPAGEIGRVLAELRLTPVRLDLVAPRHPRLPVLILERLADRPLPGPEAIARYVARRTGVSAVAETVADCLACGLYDDVTEPGVSRSTLSRRLSGFGPLTARDWTALGQLLAVLHDDPPNPEGTAKRRRLDRRTVRNHIHDFTGLTVPDARRRPGWEWVVEAALRHWGYVKVVPAKPAASAAGGEAPRRRRVSGEW